MDGASPSKKSRIEQIKEGVKFAGGVGVVVAFVVVIIIIIMMFSCVWPFRTFLASCVKSRCLMSNPLNKWTEFGCVYIPINYPTCDSNHYLKDNVCVPLCQPDEIYMGNSRCIKKICPNQYQVGDNVCIPDITGYYREIRNNSPVNNKMTKEHKILSTPGQPYMLVRNNTTRMFVNPDKSLSTTGNTSIEYDGEKIKWDDGSYWERIDASW